MALIAYFVGLMALCATPLVPAREKTENWVAVHSPHFAVATNTSERQARRIADQLERMRAVFHAAFPKLQNDSDAPIVVLAVKNDKDMRALEPEAYLAKGSLQLAGLFLTAPDKNYVLMRVDAEGDHPYATIYHEYTHFLLRKGAEWMPLWMNEGLAEFYQNTDIHEKDADLGQASGDDIQWLKQNRLLPLRDLFTVDQKSPYYHEENKGSIFYAESWALVHYIEINDYKQKTHRMTDYAAQLAEKVDPVTAAERAFGDLKKLQSDLDVYIHGSSFSYFREVTKTEVDDSAFTVTALTSTQSDALRADFLAYDQRAKDADALLDHVLKEDANNTLARETKGYIEFRQGNLGEAEKWYLQAVQLDSKSYLAHYYYAAIAMNHGGGPEDDRIETSLRAAIQLNPAFAPAFDRLAVYLGMHGKDLDEARLMGVKAVQLDPSSVAYRVNLSNIFMAMRQPDNAVAVLQMAAKVAKSPEERAAVDSSLTQAYQFAETQKRFAAQGRNGKDGTDDKDDDDSDAEVTTTSTVSPPRLAHRPEFVPKGPHRFLVGMLQGVHCDDPAIELTVAVNGRLVALHADNYYKLQFSALGFQPSASLNPCSDLEGRPAKVEYVESANASNTPQLLSVELHK